MRGNYISEEEKQERERQVAKRMIDVMSIASVASILGAIIGYLVGTL